MKLSKILLIQICIFHYCFLVIQEFNDLLKFDIVFNFLFFGSRLKRVTTSTYFLNHIDHHEEIILDDIYYLIMRQMLTPLFQQQKKPLNCLLHFYQSKLERDPHAGLAEFQEFFCIYGHFIIERFRYVTNYVDFSGISGELFFYLAVKLLKDSHKGLKVNPFQDTDVPHPGFIYPYPVVGRFSNKNIHIIHNILLVLLTGLDIPSHILR